MNEQGLTVKQLREILAEYPDDMEVFVDGYEGGIDSLFASNIRKCPVKKNVYSKDESWWEGRHRVPWGNEDADCEGVILSG